MKDNNIKVFISSTFQDLEIERSYLVQKVFPEIRAHLNGITVSEVDLRWGITDEESREKRVVDLCLQYLYESKPYFIGIIGRRYGSVISPKEVELSPFVEDSYPHVQEDLEKGLSVTEIEIMNGVFRAPEGNRPKAIFFVDKSDIPWPGEEGDKFEKLQRLKEKILNQNEFPVVDLEKPEDLDKVKDFILNGIGVKARGTDDNKEETINLINAYRNQQALYLENIPDNFQVLDQLMPLVERANPTAILEGTEGSGKSSLVAQLGSNYKNSKRLFIHLYGNIAVIPSTNSMFISFFLEMARQMLHQCFQEEASKKTVGSWFKRNFLKVDLSIEEELVSEIANHKWCFVLDNMNALRLHYISPMLYVVPAIINGISVIEQHYKKKIDFRIILVQSSNSPYNQPDGKYEKLFMPLGTTLNAKKFVDEYLSSYSKRLSKEQIERLHNCSLTVHPRSLFMVCEYLRKYGKHEKLSEAIKRLDNFQYTTDTYKLFIDGLRESFDEAQIRRLVALISLFSHGMSKKHLEDLSGMNNLDFHRAWSYLSNLTKEEQDGAIHWENDTIARFMESTLNICEANYRTSIANECYKYFYHEVDNLFTPEKLYISIKKTWWLWKSDLIASRTDRDKTVIELRNMGDMMLGLYLRSKGYFTFEHISKNVYPLVFSRVISEEYKKTIKDFKAEAGDTDIKLLLKNQSLRKVLSNNLEKRLSYYRKPTKVELLCYLESLCASKKWKQLEVELANPEVLNYVWQTSVLLDCWLIGMKDGNISIIQPDQKNNVKMLHVALALHETEGIKYYSEAQKQ